MYLLNFYQGRELRAGGVVLEGRITVGRNCENHVVLPDSSVSRHHAAFYLEKKDGVVHVMLRDFGSTNGCEVNGHRFRNAEARIQPGDSVWLGAHRVEIIEQPVELAGLTDEGDQTILYAGPPHCQDSLPLDRLRALHQLATKTSGVDMDQLLENAWHTISACLRHDVLCAVLREDSAPERVLAWNSEGPTSPVHLPISRRLVQKCLHENLAILADKKPGPDAPHIPDDSGAWASLSSAMCVPLVDGERSLGALYVGSVQTHVIYDQDDLQFLILVSNQVAGAIVHRRVIQDLRAEAEKLEAVLGSLQEGVLVADRGFNILSANHAARRILEEQDLVGRRLEDVLSRFRNNFDPRLLPGRGRFQIMTGPTKDDPDSPGPRIFSASVSENSGDDQDAWRYVVCLHDVTHVERNERMKSVLLNRLAHKLRTPLTVVAGVNGILAQHVNELKDPEVRGLVQQSQQHCEQCAALIDRFMEYTSLDLAPEALLPDSRSRLEALVAAGMSSNQEMIARKRFAVVRLFEDGKFLVRGKEETLSLVFHHIVQNAVKFGRGGGKLTIEGKATEGMIRVRFHDDGPGIPPAEMEYLFQLLHQVDADNTGQVPGAGLGLWLAKTVLEAHGGDIKIVSPAGPEGGTIVEILLPASSESEEDAVLVPPGIKAFADTDRI